MAREPKGPAQKSKQEAAREVAELAQMSKLAADLSEGLLPDAYAAEMVLRAETQLGFRCQGCGERVTVGLKFTLIEARNVEGRPTVDVSQLTACNGENGCDFAEDIRKADPPPTAMEMVEYAWLSPDPADKLPKPSPEASGSDPARPPESAPTEAAGASGEDPPAIELPPGVDRD